MPDEAIDIIDIPEVSADNMTRGYRGAGFKPIKTPITIRLDTDIIAWFKDNAKNGRYQTAINQALREFMTKAPKRAP